MTILLWRFYVTSFLWWFYCDDFGDDFLVMIFACDEIIVLIWFMICLWWFSCDYLLCWKSKTSRFSWSPSFSSLLLLLLELKQTGPTDSDSQEEENFFYILRYTLMFNYNTHTSKYFSFRKLVLKMSLLISRSCAIKTIHAINTIWE